jgi:signal transduction histidine kinase/DNA-binding response OmpR family regulator/CHASE3 domain sensor protein
MTGTNPQNTRLTSGISGSGKTLATNRLVLLGAVPLFLMLAVVAYLTVQFAVNERAAQGWVRHTYQVLETTRQLMEDVQAAESSQRGYLIDKDPGYFQTYKAAATRVPADLKAFRDLTRDNSEQQDRASRLQHFATVRLDTLAVNVALAQAAGSDMTALSAGLQRGHQQMRDLRQEATGAISEELRLLAERDRQRRDIEYLEIAFAIGAAVLTLGILLIATAMLVRNNVSLAASERARANEAAILQATLNTVREGIAYFTSEGLLCAFNSGFFELLSLPAAMARIQHTTLDELRSVEIARPFADRVFTPLSPGQDGADTQHIAWGGRALDIYKAPVATGGFLIGVVDVTARMHAEATVRQSQKMEAIGHLTGGVAHDFNNLLQIISANLDLAVSGTVVQSDTRLRDRLQNAIGAVVRGSRLTGQLLAFARRQPLEPKSVDLGRVIRDMSDLLRRTLGENIQVETVIAGGLWNTLADPNQVENTVLNMAINARDAMPEGGKLTLEVANAHLDDAYAAGHSEVTPGQYVMLAVTDTGTGMSPEVLSRVFEPFFTTKPEGKGTGLGLAQAFGFTKQSGGHIKIYSEVGHGTAIKLYLPRTRRETDALEIAAPPSEGGSESILVVEDDEGVRAAVADMLSDLGYQVSRAENAESALTLLKTLKPDLIFTDVVMPGAIHTRDFTRMAKEMHPGIHILYTSGYTQNAIVHNGKLDDDALLLSKPYRKDELARKLRSVFAGTARGPIAAPAAAPVQRGKVLVVEDVALIRMTTMDMVEQMGFDAAEAADAAEALEILRTDDAIAILLTDLGLPGMNGRQLVEEALRQKPHLKVIIASGYSTNEDEGANLPANVGYLTKPFDMAQLRRALEA